MKVDIGRAKELAKGVNKTFQNEDVDVIGYALAVLVAMYVAGHCDKADEETTEALRATTLLMFTELVFGLIPQFSTFAEGAFDEVKRQ